MRAAMTHRGAVLKETIRSTYFSVRGESHERRAQPVSISDAASAAAVRSIACLQRCTDGFKAQRAIFAGLERGAVRRMDNVTVSVAEEPGHGSDDSQSSLRYGRRRRGTSAIGPRCRRIRNAPQSAQRLRADSSARCRIGSFEYST